MPLFRTNRIFHWLLDRAVPNNCKRQLKKASEDNLEACEKLICMLQKHKPKMKIVKSA